MTVYNGHPEIDVRVAPPQVLSALPNVTPDQLQKVLAGRLQRPIHGEALLKLLGPARELARDTPNPAIRVDARIRLDDGRTARAEVVIFVSQTDDEPLSRPLVARRQRRAILGQDALVKANSCRFAAHQRQFLSDVRIKGSLA